jgi:hypothetical protein
MPATRKPLKERYPHKMSEEVRSAIYAHLVWDRKAVSGRVHGYDPSLGDRAKSLRKQCGKAVIRLVLNRYKAW